MLKRMDTNRQMFLSFVATVSKSEPEGLLIAQNFAIKTFIDLKLTSHCGSHPVNLISTHPFQ